MVGIFSLRVRSFWISQSHLLADGKHWHCIIGCTIKLPSPESFGLGVIIHVNSVLCLLQYLLSPSPKPTGRLIYEKTYSNDGVRRFDDQLRRFISESGHCPMMACIAMAGPVSKPLIKCLAYTDSLISKPSPVLFGSLLTQSYLHHMQKGQKQRCGYD